MDGIFGVGISEIIIVLVILFVVGGPENTVKWARELGRWVRKARLMWADVVKELESDLGEDGKELLDAARELGQGVKDIRTMQPARKMLSEATQAVEEIAAEIEAPAQAETASASPDPTPPAEDHEPAS
jgi:Sec-independent protein translocase protein TatA